MTMNLRLGCLRKSGVARGSFEPHLAARSRRRRPVLEGLEARLAPAVAGSLYVVGTTLVYNGNFANNNITVSGTDGGFKLTDTAGSINSTVPGMSAAQLGAGTAVVPSYVQSIAINGQNGADVVNDSGLHTGRNLLVTGTFVNLTGGAQAKSFTITGQVVSLSGSLDTTLAGPIAGSVSINGTLNDSSGAATTINTHGVIDGNVTLSGLVAGAGNLVINAGPGGNVTAAQAINLSGAFSVTNANNVNLHQVIGGGATSITAQKAVNLNGSLISTGAVTILANQGAAGPYGFTQVAGNITSAGAVSITVNKAGAGGTGSALLRGITAVGPVTLDTQGAANSGGAIRPADGSVSFVTVPGGSLTALAGPGGIRLNTAVATLSAQVASGALAGDINLLNSTGAALSLGATATSNGSITLANNADINVSTGNSVTAGGANSNVSLSATNGSINVALGSTVVAGNVLTINATGDINTDASPTSNLQAPRIRLTAGGSIGATSTPFFLNIHSITTLTATSAGTFGIFVTDDLPLTVASASTIGGGPIDLETSGTSDLTIAGNVLANGGGTVTLASGRNLNINSGTVSSDTSTVNLVPGQNLSIAAPATVSAGGSITLTPSGTGTTVAIAGVVAATTSIILTGDITNLFTSGTISAGTSLSVTLSGTGATTVGLGGSISSGSDLTLTLSGPTLLYVTGSITSGGNATITSGTDQNLSLIETGSINAANALNLIADGLGVFTSVTVLDLFGSTIAGTVLNISGAASGPFSLVTSSSTVLSGQTGVTITGSSAAANTIMVVVPISTNGAAIAISGGTADDVFSVAPSLTGQITVTGGGGSDTLVFPTVQPISSSGSAPSKTYSFAGGYQDVITSGIANEP